MEKIDITMNTALMSALKGDDGLTVAVKLNGTLYEQAEGIIDLGDIQGGSSSGGVSKEYVDNADTVTLSASKEYTDTKFSSITLPDIQGAISNHNSKSNSHSDIRLEAKSYTDNQVATLIGGAPEQLNTLKEIADAMSENSDVLEVLNQSISSKLNKTDAASLYVPKQGYVAYSSDEKTKLSSLANYNDASLKTSIGERAFKDLSDVPIIKFKEKGITSGLQAKINEFTVIPTAGNLLPNSYYSVDITGGAITLNAPESKEETIVKITASEGFTLTLNGVLIGSINTSTAGIYLLSCVDKIWIGVKI